MKRGLLVGLVVLAASCGGSGTSTREVVVFVDRDLYDSGVFFVRLDGEIEGVQLERESIREPFHVLATKMVAEADAFENLLSTLSDRHQRKTFVLPTYNTEGAGLWIVDPSRVLTRDDVFVVVEVR